MTGAMTKQVLVLCVAVVVAALGGAAVVLGGADDSPGLQGIGVLLVAGALLVTLRVARRSGHTAS